MEDIVHIHGSYLYNRKEEDSARYGIRWQGRPELDHTEPYREDTDKNAHLEAAIHVIEQATRLVPHPKVLKIFTSGEEGGMLTKDMMEGDRNITRWRDGEEGEWEKAEGQPVEYQHQYEELLNALVKFIDHEEIEEWTQVKRRKVMKIVWKSVLWVHVKTEIVHIQGSCLYVELPNPSGGYGIRWCGKPGLDVNKHLPFHIRDTNNNADLEAATQLLNQVICLDPRPEVLKIYTRVEMLTNAIMRDPSSGSWWGTNICTWKDEVGGRRWIKTNGQPVVNQPQYEKLLDALGELFDHERKDENWTLNERRDLMVKVWGSESVLWKSPKKKKEELEKKAAATTSESTKKTIKRMIHQLEKEREKVTEMAREGANKKKVLQEEMNNLSGGVNAVDINAVDIDD